MKILQILDNIDDLEGGFGPDFAKELEAYEESLCQLTRATNPDESLREKTRQARVKLLHSLHQATNQAGELRLVAANHPKSVARRLLLFLQAKHNEATRN